MISDTLELVEVSGSTFLLEHSSVLVKVSSSFLGNVMIYHLLGQIS
jgi:hypothetical protein